MGDWIERHDHLHVFIGAGGTWSAGEAVDAPSKQQSRFAVCHASVSVEPTKAFYSHTLRCRESNAKHGRQPTGIATGHLSNGNTMLPVLAVHQNRCLPTISDLLHLAVTETDFVGDLDPDTLEANCANSIDLAADIWSDAHGYATVPLSLIQWARCALLLEAEAMLRDREAQAEAERLDAITAGDIDADGRFIPYDTYRGV